MSVVYELKQKRTALTDRLQQLERDRADIQELMRALDRVILSYEPDYQVPTLARPELSDRSRKVKQSSSEVKAAMGGVNKRQAVLEVLREAGEPISVADCAVKFAAKLGIPSEPANLSDIAHRLSAVLTQLTAAGRVRHSGKFNGRKVLWEVAA
jgi:predicted transcriptional regulator with HTH domain